MSSGSQQTAVEHDHCGGAVPGAWWCTGCGFFDTCAMGGAGAGRVAA